MTADCSCSHKKQKKKHSAPKEVLVPFGSMPRPTSKGYTTTYNVNTKKEETIPVKIEPIQANVRSTPTRVIKRSQLVSGQQRLDSFMSNIQDRPPLSKTGSALLGREGPALLGREGSPQPKHYGFRSIHSLNRYVEDDDFKPKPKVAAGEDDKKIVRRPITRLTAVAEEDDTKKVKRRVGRPSKLGV